MTIQKYKAPDLAHMHPDKDGQYVLKEVAIEQAAKIDQLQKAVTYLLCLTIDDLSDSETKYINKIEEMLL